MMHSRINLGILLVVLVAAFNLVSGTAVLQYRDDASTGTELNTTALGSIDLPEGNSGDFRFLNCELAHS